MEALPRVSRCSVQVQDAETVRKTSGSHGRALEEVRSELDAMWASGLPHLLRRRFWTATRRESGPTGTECPENPSPFSLLEELHHQQLRSIELLKSPCTDRRQALAETVRKIRVSTKLNGRRHLLDIPS